MSIPATSVLVCWQLPRYCQTGFALAVVLPLCFEDKRRRRIYGMANDGGCKERERERDGKTASTRCDNISRTSVSCPVGLNNADCNYRKQREFVSVVTPLLSEGRLNHNELASVGFENIPFETRPSAAKRDAKAPRRLSSRLITSICFGLASRSFNAKSSSRKNVQDAPSNRSRQWILSSG